MTTPPTPETPLTPEGFVERFELPDWRIVDGCLEGRFRGASFAAGAAFVGVVGELADAAVHHPDIELRYPGILRIVLVTHAVGALTVLDGELATRISAAAVEHDVEPVPATT